MTWQPIETAPKDGTEIVVWGTFGPVAARWNGREWRGTWEGSDVIEYMSDFATGPHHRGEAMTLIPALSNPTVSGLPVGRRALVRIGRFCRGAGLPGDRAPPIMPIPRWNARKKSPASFRQRGQ